MKKKYVIMIGATSAVALPLIGSFVAGGVILSQKNEATYTTEERFNNVGTIRRWKELSNLDVEFVANNGIETISSVSNLDSSLSVSNFTIVSNLTANELISSGYSVQITGIAPSGRNAVEVTFTVSKSFKTNAPAISQTFTSLVTGFKVTSQRVIEAILQDKPIPRWNTIDGLAPKTKTASELTPEDFINPVSQFGETYSISIDKSSIAPTNTEVTLNITVTDGVPNSPDNPVVSGTYNVQISGITDPVKSWLNERFAERNNIPRITYVGSIAQSTILPSEFSSDSQATLRTNFVLNTPTSTDTIINESANINQAISIQFTIDGIDSINNDTGEVSLRILASPAPNSATHFENFELTQIVTGFQTLSAYARLNLGYFVDIINTSILYNASIDSHGIISDEYLSTNNGTKIDDIYATNSAESFQAFSRTIASIIIYDIDKFVAALNLFETIVKAATPEQLQALKFNKESFDWFLNHRNSKQHQESGKNFSFTINQATKTADTSVTIELEIVDLLNHTATTKLSIPMNKFLTQNDYLIYDAYNNASRGTDRSQLDISYQPGTFGNASAVLPSVIVQGVMSEANATAQLEKLKSTLTITKPEGATVDFEIVQRPPVKNANGVETTFPLITSNDASGSVSFYVKLTLTGTTTTSTDENFVYLRVTQDGFLSSTNLANRNITDAINKKVRPSFVSLDTTQNRLIVDVAPSDLTVENFTFLQSDLTANQIANSVNLRVSKVIVNTNSSASGVVTLEITASSEGGTSQTYTVDFGGFKSDKTENQATLLQASSTVQTAIVNENSRELLPSALQTNSFTLINPISDKDITFQVTRITAHNDVLGTATISVLATLGTGDSQATTTFSQSLTGLFTIKRFLDKQFTEEKVKLKTLETGIWLPSELAQLKSGDSVTDNGGVFKNKPTNFLNAVSPTLISLDSNLRVKYDLIATSAGNTIAGSNAGVQNLGEAIPQTNGINDAEGVLRIRVAISTTTTTAINGAETTVYSSPQIIEITTEDGLISNKTLLENYLNSSLNSTSIVYLPSTETNVNSSKSFNEIPSDIIQANELVFNPSVVDVPTMIEEQKLKIQLSVSGITNSNSAAGMLTATVRAGAGAAFATRTIDLSGFMTDATAVQMASDKKLVPVFKKANNVNATKESTKVSELSANDFNFAGVSGIITNSSDSNGNPIYQDENGVIYRINSITNDESSRNQGITVVTVTVTKKTSAANYTTSITGFAKG
ncbi:lipoprotein-associated protein [Mycoplasma testudineum]|uniref:Lipoprotein-associated protein n=1 Tax=Mycoplasma testudineum TaxID=244584 RepID=A0A4R6ICW7_9MOLU|nr:lipoprotein 17-related variable surface protein [Mycoplasma testudineum]OYD26595.1 hypothetical protein CG473_03085 [Mycoplasma testudineum]TDO19427.1 lipoprotein-associated protein [Mycoplasma testudineum]